MLNRSLIAALASLTILASPELRAQRPVRDPVVHRQRAAHHGRDRQRAVLDHRPLLARAQLTPPLPTKSNKAPVTTAVRQLAAVGLIPVFLRRIG